MARHKQTARCSGHESGVEHRVDGECKAYKRKQKQIDSEKEAEVIDLEEQECQGKIKKSKTEKGAKEIVPKPEPWPFHVHGMTKLLGDQFAMVVDNVKEMDLKHVQQVDIDLLETNLYE